MYTLVEITVRVCVRCTWFEFVSLVLKVCFLYQVHLICTCYEGVL